MKAATGDLSLTVITVIAIALVSGLFIGVLWPQIKTKITDQWSDINEGCFNEDGTPCE